MDKKKKIVYSEPLDYFPEETRKKHKLGEYADEDTLEDCGGIQPLPMIEEIERTQNASEDKEAKTKRRLRGRTSDVSG